MVSASLCHVRQRARADCPGYRRTPFSRYRYEKAIETFEKENPKDPLGDLWIRLKPALTSVAILGAGFYAIPVVRGISQGIQTGNFFGSLSQAMSTPTEALNGIEVDLAGLASKASETIQ